MSVSLWMIPAALAVRVVLGKKGLDDFLQNNQSRIESNIRFDDDLVRIVKKAGFSIEKVGRSYKTEIPALNTFFFWDKILGNYYASYSVYDDPSLIKDVLSKIEKSAGRKLFDLENSVSENISRKTRYITDFQDKDLLLHTLKKYRLEPFEQNSESFSIRTGNIVLKFEKTDSGPFYMVFEKDEDMKEIFAFFKLIDEDYRRQVQNIAVESVKKKVADSGYRIENMETLSDNSVIITVDID